MSLNINTGETFEFCVASCKPATTNHVITSSYNLKLLVIRTLKLNIIHIVNNIVMEKSCMGRE